MGLGLGLCCCEESNPTLNYCPSHSYQVFSSIHHFDGVPQHSERQRVSGQPLSEIPEYTEQFSPPFTEGPWSLQFGEERFRSSRQQNQPQRLFTSGEVNVSSDGAISAQLVPEQFSERFTFSGFVHHPVPAERPPEISLSSVLSFPIRTSRGFEISLNGLSTSWNHPDRGLESSEFRFAFGKHVFRRQSRYQIFFDFGLIRRSFFDVSTFSTVEDYVTFLNIYPYNENDLNIGQFFEAPAPSSGGPVDFKLRVTRSEDEPNFLLPPFAEPHQLTFTLLMDDVPVISETVDWHIGDSFVFPLENLPCRLDAVLTLNGESVEVDSSEIRILRNVEPNSGTPLAEWVTSNELITVAGNQFTTQVGYPRGSSETITLTLRDLVPGNAYAVLLKNASSTGDRLRLSDRVSLSTFIPSDDPQGVFYFQARSNTHNIAAVVEKNVDSEFSVTADVFVVDQAPT